MNMGGPSSIDLGGSCEGCSRSLLGEDRFYALRTHIDARVPAGVVRRLLPGPAPSEVEVDEAKRNTLKLVAIGGAVALGTGGLASFLRFAVPPPAGSSTYPKVQLLYDDGTPVLVSKYRHSSSDNALIVFNYPLSDEPNMLIQLPNSAPGGVGPNQSLVAFSAICQHLGCAPPYISYYPAGTCPSFNGGKAFIHCVCHGSSYDPSSSASGGGAVILSGPTQSPLPQVTLMWDQTTDYLYAVGMVGPPVKGHTSTLVGGTAVTSPVQTAPPQTPTQQCPT